MRAHNFEGFHFEKIEDYPCNSKDELRAREGYWIERFKAEGRLLYNKINEQVHRKGRETEYIREYMRDFRRRNPQKNREYAQNYVLRQRNRTYYCECCQKEMPFLGKYSHFKTREHRANIPQRPI